MGGSLNYGGAPRFAAQAFMRSGGGYVHMVVPETLVIPLAIGFPEAVLHPQKTEDGFLEMAHLDEIEKLAAGKGSLVIGPGLGLRSETGDFVRELIHGTDIPVIIDGDGLTHLAGHASLLRGREAFLTPHPGEASRLLGISVAEVEQDRPAAVRRLADLYHARVVLKGAHSLITGPGEEIYMNLSGSTALATAGSGDILGGIVASLLGGGLKGTDALRTAVFIHGLAGEAAGRKLGEDGVTASDILACLPRAVNDYRMNFETYRSGLTGKIGTIP